MNLLVRAILGFAFTFIYVFNSFSQTPTSMCLVGTVTNYTNPAAPVSAQASMTFDVKKGGVLRIGPPLYGSGQCWALNVNDKSNEIAIYSRGPLCSISWIGKVVGGRITGTYEVTNLAQPRLPEQGTFDFQIADCQPLSLGDALAAEKVKIGEKEYVAFKERDILSLHNLDETPTGFRLVLDQRDEPLFIIVDRDTGATFLDAKTKNVVLEWLTNGKDGYYVRKQAELTTYFDRFLNALPWVSATLKGGDEIFLRVVGDSVELYDKGLKPLNIRSGKTSAGLTYWAKTEGEVTAYYDKDFKPLNWYSVEREGRIYYATFDKKGKVRVFDSNGIEQKKQKEPGFWARLAYGVAVGLSAYAQALQQQSALYATPITTPSYGIYGSYGASASTTTYNPSSNLSFSSTQGPGTLWSSTTSTRIGNTAFYDTYGNWGNSLMTSQRIGNFLFFDGYAHPGGSFSGTIQSLGPFDFADMQTSTGAWHGTSQRLGTFTFHDFYGPRGQSLHGTSQKIGDFIFTTIR